MIVSGKTPLGLNALALLVACSAYAPAVSQPVTYYISPSGNDNHPGTSPTQAWQTIDRVNQGSYQGGDRILFEGGKTFKGSLYFDFNNGHDTTKKSITINSYGKGRATIEANKKCGLYVYNIGGFHIANLNFVGVNPSCEPSRSEAGIFFYNDSSDTISHVDIDQVESSKFCYGILLGTNNSNTSRYDNVRITSAVSHDNLDSGISASGVFDPAHSLYAFSNVYVGYSHSYSNRGWPKPDGWTGAGIMLYGLDHALIEHNCAHDNGGIGNNPPASGGPVAVIIYGDHVTIQHNEAYRQGVNPITGTDGGGFNLNGSYGLIQYNYSHDNDGIGFLLDDNKPFNHNIIVRYNISENDNQKIPEGSLWVGSGGGGGTGGGIINCQIHNNTIYTKGIGGSPAVHIANDRGQTTTNKIFFYNNALITNNGAPLVQINIPQDSSDVLFQRNAYWATGEAFAIKWGEMVYESLDNWRDNTGQEIIDKKPLGVVTNPLLNNLGKGGILYPKPTTTLEAYTLQAGSPLINAGLDLRSLGIAVGSQDFYGHRLPTAGKKFDIGAYQHVVDK